MTSTTPQPLNRLRKLWREGRPTFGAIATIPSIQTVQIMARSGFDWIVVDLEHGPIDLGSAHAMITATSGTSCIPLARIAANEPWLAKAPMDIGALGINFPMICSREQAESPGGTTEAGAPAPPPLHVSASPSNASSTSRKRVANRQPRHADLHH